MMAEHADIDTNRRPVGIRSLALADPRGIRTNAFWHRRHPDMIAACEEWALARLYAPHPSSPGARLFDATMAPYLADPFRGAVARRLLAPGETTLALEARAGRTAVAAAGLELQDIDLLICCSFLPEFFGPGNAAFLCDELGLGGTAWNLESTCSGAFQALRTATSLIRAGEHRNVLVVVSCTYSRVVEPTDTLAWNIGDAVGAFVVGELARGEGVLGAHSIHTASTCGNIWTEMVAGAGGEAQVRLRVGPDSGRTLSEHTGRSIVACCRGAAERAGVALEAIDRFIFPTPVPWCADLACRSLGVDRVRTISMHAEYANVGPALPLVNLFHAARSGLIRRGDLVLVSTFGAVGSAGAAVMRWGEVGLGPGRESAADVSLD
ncbi:3-oxoacyl-ACP synthase III family protein [Nannocystis punicea]|uniref:3-oxoacyl-ACP synthase III family protein n=1 Tax=Nannocystis punicea TaxID=2995304 RepID=A0ABY7HCB4_9BACT|nr:3-oxoacyl-ACP synthase III family protein [Nannocystis poenicansa]WAS96740.1 3-oxoacyl-ACP synthase III family protein [Nannocystis poenicansa]